MHGVDPARILMLTFSRRAAQAMRRRARDIVKQALNENLGGLNQVLAQRLSWSGTFHSMANRLLRHYARHLKLDPQFTVIDRGDSADLMDAIRGELGFAAKEQRFPRRDTCLAIYSHRVNTRKSLKESLDEQYPWCAQWEDELTQLYRGYVQRKQRYGILDYDDLLLYWHIMMGDAKLAQHVRRALRSCAGGTNTRTPMCCRRRSCGRCGRMVRASRWWAMTPRLSTRFAPRRSTTS